MPQVLQVRPPNPPPPRPPSGPRGLMVAVIALSMVLLVGVTVLITVLLTRPSVAPLVVTQSPSRGAAAPALPATAPVTAPVVGIPTAGIRAANPVYAPMPGVPIDPRLPPGYSSAAERRRATEERRRFAEERRRRLREARLRAFAPQSAPPAAPPSAAALPPGAGLPPGHTLSAPAYPRQPYVNSYSGSRPGQSRPVMPAANPGPPPAAASPQDVVARVKGSVVLVLADTPDGISSGTGFVVSGSQVATCAHVIEDARRILVITGDGRQIAGFAGQRDVPNDVALLNCGAGLPAPVRLGNSDLAREGDEVAVTGYPVVDKFLALGYAPNSSTTFGRINAKRVRMQSGLRVEELQTDASINPGNSGGPVYSTRDGQVVGLASSVLVQERGIGFAATINALRRLLGR